MLVEQERCLIISYVLTLQSPYNIDISGKLDLFQSIFESIHISNANQVKKYLYS